MWNKIKNISLLYTLYESDKKILSKIDQLNNSSEDAPFVLLIAKGYENVEKSVLEEFHKTYLDVKKTLEDKAKSSLIAITISTTLMFNVSKFIQEISYINELSMYIILILSILSMGYMIIAGFLSLYSLSEINQIGNMYIEDYKSSDSEAFKKQLAENIEFNVMNNTRRNNFMNTSYNCIIRSLFLLFIVFIFYVGISIQNNQSLKSSIQTQIYNINNEMKINEDNNVELNKIIDSLKIQVKDLENEYKKLKDNYVLIVEKVKNSTEKPSE